jgi:hypothetical protein
MRHNEDKLTVKRIYLGHITVEEAFRKWISVKLKENN